ncbi:MAG: hypothetical protein U1E19_13140 [Rhodoblastus sp.]
MRAGSEERQSMRPCRKKREPLRPGGDTIQEPLRAVAVETRVSDMEQARDDLEIRLRALRHDELDALYDAAAEAIAAFERMAASGRNPVTAALDGADIVEEWSHYPEGDSRGAAGRYYYHAHPAEERGADEHGHFHIFLEPPPAEAASQPTHVVGLAMDAGGRLLRLFTTNGWVTDETWRGAEWVAERLPGFSMTSDPARPDLDQWIAAIVRLFRPQIEALLRARDAALAVLLEQDPAALEDRSVRILSESPVDLYAQVRAVECAMDEAARLSPA